MSNQDEDEVEDELEAMEREVAGVPSLPAAPNVIKEDMPNVPQETPAERAKRRELILQWNEEERLVMMSLRNGLRCKRSKVGRRLFPSGFRVT